MTMSTFQPQNHSPLPFPTHSLAFPHKLQERPSLSNLPVSISLNREEVVHTKTFRHVPVSTLECYGGVIVTKSSLLLANSWCPRTIPSLRHATYPAKSVVTEEEEEEQRRIAKVMFVRMWKWTMQVLDSVYWEEKHDDVEAGDIGKRGIAEYTSNDWLLITLPSPSTYMIFCVRLISATNRSISQNPHHRNTTFTENL